jgi:hypothetical protein
MLQESLEIYPDVDKIVKIRLNAQLHTVYDACGFTGFVFTLSAEL